MILTSAGGHSGEDRRRKPIITLGDVLIAQGSHGCPELLRFEPLGFMRGPKVGEHLKIPPECRWAGLQ